MATRFRRDEDEADKWLREHDPYYKDSSRNKRCKQQYYYETPEQERRRREIEIPISNLTNAQKVQFSNAGGGSYTESGEFNL